MKDHVKFNKLAFKLDKGILEEIQHEADEYGVDLEEVDVVRKSFATETKAQLEPGSRSAIRYVSTRDVDSSGDIIVPKGVNLKLFKQTGMPVFWAHDYSNPQIGKDEWAKADDYGIKVKQIYAKSDNPASLSNVLWELTAQGMNKSSSVGLIPLEVLNKGDERFEPAVKALKKEWPELKKTYKSLNRIITKSLLFEHSDVALPANFNTSVEEVSKMFKAAGADDVLLKQIGLDISEEVKPEVTIEDKGELKVSKSVTYTGDTGEVKDLNEGVSEGTDTEEADTEEKEAYSCECIDCGHKAQSDQHCKDITCSECGGTMRRAERPGPGQKEKQKESKVTLVGKYQEPQTVRLVRKHVPDYDYQATLKDLVEAELRRKKGRLL